MTDATSMQTDVTANSNAGEHLGEGVRGFLAGLKRLGAQIAEFHANWRRERDFDRIHDALSKLNNRQLEMLGMNREDIYSFADVCVHNPERRPVLRLSQPGPVLALPGAEAAPAMIADATPAAEAPKAVTAAPIVTEIAEGTDEAEIPAAVAAKQAETGTRGACAA